MTCYSLAQDCESVPEILEVAVNVKAVIGKSETFVLMLNAGEMISVSSLWLRDDCDAVDR